jgi:hypothetical protein
MPKITVPTALPPRPKVAAPQVVLPTLPRIQTAAPLKTTSIRKENKAV